MTYNVFGETLNLTLSIYAAPHMLPLFVAIPPLGEPCSLLIPKIRVWDGGGSKVEVNFALLSGSFFSCQAYTTEPLIYFGHLGDESAGWPENSAVKHRRAT